MRLRHKPNAIPEMRENNKIFFDASVNKGKWKDIFGNDNPIHLEIGAGKGDFVTQMANLHKDINYIALEMNTNAFVVASRKMLDEDMTNVRAIIGNAENLEEFFEKGEVDKIYLNFSTPWPKKRHEKRRLTYKSFLDTFKQILPEKGEVHFKTDNRGLFEYSLVSFSQYGMKLKGVWLDLHASDFEGNVLTEYEQKFSSKGQVIYRVEAVFQ